MLIEVWIMILGGSAVVLFSIIGRGWRKVNKDDKNKR